MTVIPLNGIILAMQGSLMEEVGKVLYVWKFFDVVLTGRSAQSIVGICYKISLLCGFRRSARALVRSCLGQYPFHYDPSMSFSFAVSS